MTTKKKRKKRKIGRNLLVLAILCLAPAAFGDKKAADAHGVVAGTVFREPGFALPGAEVTLEPDPEPGQAAVKMKKIKQSCNMRGEFAFRVPVTAMRYQVRASAKGFAPQQKPVSIEGETRMDVTFVLAPESK
jgi:hypothetical protein